MSIPGDPDTPAQPGDRVGHAGSISAEIVAARGDFSDRGRSPAAAAMFCFEREQVPTRCGRGPAAVRLGCGCAALGTARPTRFAQDLGSSRT